MCITADECRVNSDCGANGECKLITQFSYPQRQCFCQPGWFGDKCDQGTFRSCLAAYLKLWREVECTHNGSPMGRRPTPKSGGDKTHYVPPTSKSGADMSPCPPYDRRPWVYLYL